MPGLVVSNPHTTRLASCVNASHSRAGELLFADVFRDVAALYEVCLLLVNERGASRIKQ